MFAITLKHRFASTVPFEHWEWDPVRRLVLITYKVHLDIAVCSEAKPRIGDHPISRVDEQTWRIAASRYVRQGNSWYAKPHAFDSPIESSPIVLAFAPLHISEQMARAL